MQWRHITTMPPEQVHGGLGVVTQYIHPSARHVAPIMETLLKHGATHRQRA